MKRLANVANFNCKEERREIYDSLTKQKRGRALAHISCKYVPSMIKQQDKAKKKEVVLCGTGPGAGPKQACDSASELSQATHVMAWNRQSEP